MEPIKKPVQDNEHSAAKDAEFKAKKAAAAKAFADRQKKAKEDLLKFAKEITALVEKNPNTGLSKEAIEFFKARANPVVRGSGSTRVDFFAKVFGEEPKVGQSITLIDYMKKTLQSKAQLDKQVKAWAEKGIIVEFKTAANPLDSTYTIKKLAD